MRTIDQKPTTEHILSEIHKIDRQHNEENFLQHLSRLWQIQKISPMVKMRAIITALVIVMIIFVYATLSSLLVSHMQQIYKEGLNRRHLPHLNNYLPSFEQYLLRQDVRSLLQIKCGLSCLKDQKQKDMSSIQIHYVDAWTDSASKDQDIAYYDWFNFNDFNILAMGQLKIKTFAQDIKKMSRTGFSLMWNIQQFVNFKREDMERVRSTLQKYGYIYNKILSLNLRRLQGKAVEIFTPFGTKADIVNNSSMIAIQSQINLNQDLPFLREWLGYHVYLGINLFFLYETKDDSLISCIDVPKQQVLNQWWKILQQYSSYVVFFPWTSRVQSKSWLKITEAKFNAQHDYIYYYQNTAQYTIFLNTSEIIFSPIGIKLSISITDSQKINGRNHFVLETKRFVHRMCSNSSSLLKNFQYFDEYKENREVKQIFKTQNYRPGWIIGFDYIVNKRIHQYSNAEWRVNSYTLTMKQIKNIQSNKKYPHIYLSYDFSSESRSSIIAGLCYDRCLIKIVPECFKINNIDCPKPMTKLSV